MSSKSIPCPCTSGKRYGDCCAPLHDGAREPQEGEELVRSRYAAFALGKIDYLIKTLHDDHPDNRERKGQLDAALRAASSSFKYMGLTIFESQPADRDGVSRVLYLARIYRRGADVSFIELAEFLHDGTGLRYLGGRTRDASGVKERPAGLTIENFSSSGAA